MATAIRVLSIMEAAFVTGPAKNLIEFAQRARSPEQDLPAVDFSVVAYQRGSDAPQNPFVEAARAAGIPVDIIHETGRFDASVLAQLRTIVAARDPDIIQTHNVKSHFLMRLSGLWRTRCWIAFQHGYVTTDLKMRGYNQLDRWSLRAPRHVVTVCETFASDLAARGVPRDRITVRHNSIKPFAPLDPAVPASLRKTWPADAAILLSVGRLSFEKGFVDLVRALGVLKRRWPEDRFHLVIAGEGPERPRIEAARAEERLADCVTLAGLQHDIRAYYAAADLVVMPSHSEGSPNALLEAMIANRAVVATRAGGIPEIVRHEETALLVEPRDLEAMASAIHRMLHAPETRLRLAERARTVALTQYSPEAYRRALVGLYDQVLGARTAETQPAA
jgi:glycosyltransferase involved in cell wall biosynthesis